MLLGALRFVLKIIHKTHLDFIFYNHLLSLKYFKHIQLCNYINNRIYSLLYALVSTHDLILTYYIVAAHLKLLFHLFSFTIRPVSMVNGAPRRDTAAH